MSWMYFSARVSCREKLSANVSNTLKVMARGPVCVFIGQSGRKRTSLVVLGEKRQSNVPDTGDGEGRHDGRDAAVNAPLLLICFRAAQQGFNLGKDGGGRCARLACDTLRHGHVAHEVDPGHANAQRTTTTTPLMSRGTSLKSSKTDADVFTDVPSRLDVYRRAELTFLGFRAFVDDVPTLDTPPSTPTSRKMGRCVARHSIIRQV